MDENTEQNPPAHGAWWFGWIFATVVFPGVVLGLIVKASQEPSDAMLSLFGLAVFILHFVSSFRLSQGKSGWLTFGLIVGGWLLALMSLFVGCLMIVSQSR